MSNDIIQAQYDTLNDVARRFGQQAEATAQMQGRVQQSLRALQSGGWEGRGSAAFFAEMTGEVLPAVARLGAALQQAQQTTQQIVQVLRAADEEASQPFRSAGTVGAPSSAPAPDSTAAGQAAVLSDGPPFGDYNNLASIPPLVLGPGATYQDLAAMIEQMYRINDIRDGKAYGVDEPVKIVRIGENQYLVAIIGTDAGNDGDTGPNDWLANLSSGRGVPSRFQLEAQRLIEQNIPPGAVIHLAGHSQGGHVAMNLAGTQELADRYQIGSVNTMGSSGSTVINPRVGAENYHNFVLADDPIRLIEIAAPRIPFTDLTLPLNLGSPLSLFGVTGSGGSPSIDPQVIWERGGHGGYVHSPAMAERPLPFSIDRWDVVGSYRVHDYDNYSNSWQTISTGWSQGDAGQVAWGSVDFLTHMGATTAVAATQNVTKTVTQYLPGDWQVAIDRQLDAAGQYVANAPLPSQWLPGVVSDIWYGFWR